MRRFLKHLTDNPQPINEFDDCLWLTIVDTVTVNPDGTFLFRFFGGVSYKYAFLLNPLKIKDFFTKEIKIPEKAR